jgi:hypothetical protein
MITSMIKRAPRRLEMWRSDDADVIFRHQCHICSVLKSRNHSVTEIHTHFITSLITSFIAIFIV